MMNGQHPFEFYIFYMIFDCIFDMACDMNRNGKFFIHSLVDHSHT